MALNLANQTIVISGQFDGLDPEDLHWDLVAMGAFVKTSVTRTTSALIKGDNAEARHLKGAEKHGTPIIERAGLDALVAGASLDAALAGDFDKTTSELDDLKGWKIAISGKFDNRTHASIRSSLESRGARVIKSPIKSTSPLCHLLVEGSDSGFDAVDAKDAGVPFIGPDELTELLAGAPITDFVAQPAAQVANRLQVLKDLLDELVATLEPIETGDPWDDQLTLRVEPSGRAIAELHHLGGTPLHDILRRKSQRISWPAGDGEVVLTREISVR
jgi:BRCT domain type II-containing protein